MRLAAPDIVCIGAIDCLEVVVNTLHNNRCDNMHFFVFITVCFTSIFMSRVVNKLSIYFAMSEPDIFDVHDSCVRYYFKP